MSHLIKVKQPASTRSSKLIILERPSIPSHCKLSNRSFQHAAPQIWNSLLATFRAPSYSAHQPSLSYEQFHKQLKIYLLIYRFHLESTNCVLCANLPSFRISPLTGYLDFGCAPFLDPFCFLHIELDLTS